jgi:DNA repair photolyase
VNITVSEVEIGRILTRSSGYLETVCSHSLQPYRGCSLGNSLCGVGCYVQHNRYLTEGRRWGSFLEVRTNAAARYLEQVEAERQWARRARQRMTIFLSSATEPFLPQEARYGVTKSVLEAMCQEPPDALILQTHSHRVAEQVELLVRLAARCELRVHVSIETDRESLAELPSHGSRVAARLAACARLKEAGLRTVVTVSPLLPIADPAKFFQRIAEVADGVVIDHFIGGDGTDTGWRTRRTLLPERMAALEPLSVTLAYREAMIEIARRAMPGRVGVSIDGFAGRFLTD